MGVPPPEQKLLSRLLTDARVVASIIAVLVTAVIGLAVDVSTSSDGNTTHHSVQIIRSANGKEVPVTPKALAQAASNAEDTHLGGDATTQAQLNSSNHANPSAPSIAGPVPAAAPFQRGCLTRSNTVNYSYRNGTKPSLVVLHLTVSPNAVGWSDVNGVWGFLNRSATQASANYIVDGEAHCILAVAESLKSWNDAGYNSATACGIEVINTGNESVYIKSPGFHQLAVIVHDCAHRWGIPLRFAAVSGGSVVRSGVIDHYHLGAAGGGHNDIHNFGSGCQNQGPGATTSLCVEAVIRAAAALDAPAPRPVSAQSQKRCALVYTLRPWNKLTPAQKVRRVRIRASFKKWHVHCVRGHATRAG